MVAFFFPKRRKKKMPKMCAFHVPGMRATVYVNPTLVRMLLPSGANNDQTIIKFDDNHSTNVPMPADQVARLLDAALNAG